MATSIYTIEPYYRTPQEVVEALLHAEVGSDAAEQETVTPTDRPTPTHKEVWATLEGKDVAFDRLGQRVAQRDHAHVQHRVALTDGAQALPKQVSDHFPDCDLILDIIHASEYLWDTANALWGETSAQRIPWVRKQLGQVLSGNTSTVIQTLETLLQTDDSSATQQKALHKTIGYYRRNLPHMRYDDYLARGLPIGTGVIEGTCRHLVKDRMELSGMRWTEDGAQAVLNLRAVRINGDWDDYQRFRRKRQHQRLYGDRIPVTPIAEHVVAAEAA